MSDPNTPLRLPPGACDCHTHVFLDEREYPFAAARHYTPPPARIEDLAALHDALGIERVVVVQPSVYGQDNRATVRALEVLGPRRARGVAVIGSATTDDELERLSRAGVCGVRVNLIFDGRDGAAGAADELRRTAERVAPYGWHVQVFASLALLAANFETLRQLPVPVVLDHHAGAQAHLGLEQPGLSAILALLESGKAYVKLSAPYRSSTVAAYADLAALTRLLARANPDRVLWGSDWPHPKPGGVPKINDISQPFAVDNAAVLRSISRTIDDDTALRKLFSDNPQRLYGFVG